MSETTPKSVLFLSYSRRDIGLVRQLDSAIRRRNSDTWVDKKSIPSAAEWMAEIRRGIASASGFVFVMTPHSLASRICRAELSIATELSKRLLPIRPYTKDRWEAAQAKVIETLGAEADFKVPTELSKLNYIDIADFVDLENPFEGLVDQLIEASIQDLDWLNRHTRLEQDVQRWINARYSASALLRGNLLDEAEEMLEAKGKDPRLSALQREIIVASRTEQRRILERDATELAGHILSLPDDRIGLGVMLTLEGLERYLPVPKLKGALRTLMSNWSQRTLMQHVAPVSCAVFVQKGERVLSACEDGRIRLFDADTGRLQQTMGEDDAPLEFLGLAEQPERAIVWSGNGGLQFLDFVTDDSSSIELISGEIQGLATSADGRLVVAACGTVPVVLDLDNQRKFNLPSHPAPIICVAVVRHQLVLTCCEDGRVRLFDLVTDTSSEISLPEDQTASRILVSPDATWAALAGPFTGIYIVDLETRKILDRLEAVSSALQLACDSQGARLALADIFGRVLVFDIHTRNLLLERQIFRRFARSLALNEDGSLLCAGSDDGAIAIVEISSAREQRYFGHSGVVTSVHFDDDARSIVSSGRDGTARVFQVLGSPVSLTIEHDAIVIGAELAPDGSRLVTAARDGAVRLFDAKAGKLHFERLGPEDELISATFVSSHEVIAAYKDGSIIMLDVAEGRETLHIETSPMETHCRARVMNGRRLVIGRFDEILRIVSLDDGNIVENLSPSDMEDLRSEYNLQTGRLANGVRVVFPEIEPHVPHLSVDGARIDLELPDVIADARLSPDGLVVAAASVNRPEVFVFDTATGELLSTLWVGHSVNGAAFGPDGRSIVATWLNAISIMDFPPFEELLAQARSQLHRKLTDEERAQFGLPRATA
ncbi:toll/interleukin-1 receptor domain-containing protein [Roseobacter sp. A03A-229]